MGREGLAEDTLLQSVWQQAQALKAISIPSNTHRKVSLGQAQCHDSYHVSCTALLVSHPQTGQRFGSRTPKGMI